MLNQLMLEINSGGTLETNHLAARLGTTPGMVEAMLEHLQRAGLIQAYTSCGDGCSGCSLKEMCEPGHNQANQPRLWQKSSS
jgi:hypothetical protein